MVIERGEVWWADLQPPTGSGPGFRRPVVVVSADSFNRSRIDTIVAAMLTSNTELASAPGNVSLSADAAGLGKDSVVDVSQIVTLDRRQMGERVGRLPIEYLDQLDAGLRLALDLH